MSPGRCPGCGGETEVVEGVPGSGGQPWVRCRVCGWSSGGPRRRLGPGYWWVWLLVGVLPVIVGPLVLPLAGRGADSSDAAFALVIGGIACCLVGGFGVAGVATEKPLNRLVLGLSLAMVLAFLNLTVALLAACAKL